VQLLLGLLDRLLDVLASRLVLGVAPAVLEVSEAVAQAVPRIKQHVKLPVGVGFGIRDAETAARIARIADAVVIGSRIIEEIEKSTPETACANVKALVAGIRAGMDAA